jgi:transposase-like protein
MRRKRVIGNGQRRRSRAEADQLVDAFEVSGLRRREFCLKHGVVVGTLDFWRKRRRERSPVTLRERRMELLGQGWWRWN